MLSREDPIEVGVLVWLKVEGMMMYFPGGSWNWLLTSRELVKILRNPGPGT